MCITQTYTAPAFSLEGFGSTAGAYMVQKQINITVPSGYRIMSITPKSGEWVIQCSVTEYNPTGVSLAIVNLWPEPRTAVNISIVVAYAKT